MLTSKTAQASISQTSIFLHVLQLLHVQTQLQRTTWTDSDRLLCLFYSGCNRFYSYCMKE